MIKRLIVPLAMALVAAACGGGSGDTSSTTPGAVSSTTTTPPTTQSLPGTSTTTTTTIASPALLEPGDTGALVAALRHYLECGGYGATPGDLFDTETILAVNAAQQALGVPVTGTPDDNTFFILGARCRLPRLLDFEGGTEGVAGAVSAGGPDEYRLAGARFQMLTVRPTGGVLLEIKGADGTVLLDAVDPVASFEVELPKTQDYTIRVFTPGPAGIYTMVMTLPAELELPTAARNTVVLDGVVFPVEATCLAPLFDGVTHVAWLDRSTGSALRVFIAEGDFNGIEVDTGTAYDGFPEDITFSNDGGRLAGRGVVFLRAPGGGDQPFGVAFDVPAATADCLVTQGDGLGPVALGARGNEVVEVVRREMGPPLQDSGWQPALSFGGCAGEELRFVRWPGLVVTLSDAATDYEQAGRRHFAAYAADGASGLRDAVGLGPGDTLGRFRSIHGTVTVEFLAGLDAYLGTVGGTSASAGLVLNLTGDGDSATVTSVSAGTAICGE